MTTTNAIQIVIHSIEEIPNNDKSASKVVENIESDEIPTCRICMEPQLEDLDPMMPLGCGCGHGLGQAHQNYLIKWFCQQRFLSTLNCNGLPNYKNCEICKTKLSPSVEELLNVHWKPFLKREMAKMNITLQGNEVLLAPEATRGAPSEVRMMWKDLRYIILAAIFIMVFVGFCIAWAIYR